VSGLAIQTHRAMAVSTPLGPDALLLTGFSGHEGLSQLFRFHLDVLAPVAEAKKLRFDQLLGQRLTVRLELPGGKQQRYFDGLCSRVSQGESDQELARFRLEMVPKCWLWTKRARSRTFQHKNVPDILKEVLAGLKVRFDLRFTYHPRDFCVQYRETDFNFASRLMEEEGIYYYFTHPDKGGEHEMVVADTAAGHAPLPGRPTLLYKNLTHAAAHEEDIVYDWGKTQELASNKHTLWDHCFELPHLSLEAVRPITPSVKVGGTTHGLKAGNHGDLEIYDWPGEYAQRFDGIHKGGGDRKEDLEKIYQDKDRTVLVRMQQDAAASLVIHGASNCRHLVAGHRFTLTTLPGDGLAEPLKPQGDYVLTGITHSAQQGGSYRAGDGHGFEYHNNFTCIPHDLPFRPARKTPKPVVPGTQSAVVVGPRGEEIFTDKYGRVKVQFHWDRERKRNADSSCWVRVATAWAGKQWGALHIPRVGQEVLVDFLEGDPDQPVIVGSVFNAEQMPAYKLPDEKTKSYIKTNSSPGGVGFNEIRFEDKKGKEQIFIHAERNQDVRVKHDCMERVLHDRHLIVGWEKDGQKGGDQREMVYQDKHLHVHRHQVEQVEGNLLLTVGKGEAADGGNMDVVIEKDKKELIEKNSHVHVKESRKEKVDKDQALTVGNNRAESVGGKYHLQVQADRNEKVGGTQSLTVGSNQYEKVGQNHALEAGQAIHLKAGMTVVLEAGTQLTLKVGGNFVDIGPSGVTIQGSMVLINSGGAAGSGCGSSPQSPDAAEAPADAQPARPVKPAVADDARMGHKSAPN
jgi:type VI secretion system secreted protein VgrG